MQQPLEVSVVLPFADDEDVIGTAVRRVANHLREYGVSFEIIAVDEDSGDNSHAVLALLRKDLAELRIASAPGRGRGFAKGAQRARGHVLWLVEPRAALAPLAPFGRAYRRVCRGEHDLVVAGARFALCHRTHCLSVLESVRGLGVTYQRRLARRAMARKLGVEQQVLGGGRRRRPTSRPWTSRVLEALAPSRIALR
jgi:hypothetical protein